jgi:hypothetical protein
VAEAVKLTVAEDVPCGADTLMFCGQVIEGGCMSLTVTVKLHIAELFAASETVQTTVVVPFGKVLPEGGVHTGEPTPLQLSPTVGSE